MNTQFGRNGDGIRLRLVEAGTLTTYTQDYAAPLPVVLQAKTGSAAAQYVYSMGTRPLSEYEAAAWEYLLPDPLGSVRQIANNSGSVTLLKSYEPYGNVLNSQGSATSVFGYAGEQVDSTGLIYLRARYMQPGLGIFLSRDAWEGDVLRPGSMNGWNYGLGNPIKYSDPSGHWALNLSEGHIWATLEAGDDWDSLFRALGINRNTIPYGYLGPTPKKFKLDYLVDDLVRKTAQMGIGVTYPQPDSITNEGGTINCYPTALTCAAGQCLYGGIIDYSVPDSVLKANSRNIANSRDIHYGDIFRIGVDVGSAKNLPVHMGMVLLRSERTNIVWSFNGFPVSDIWGPGYRIETLGEVVKHFRGDALGIVIRHFLIGPGSNATVRGMNGDSTGYYRLNSDVSTQTIRQALEEAIAELAADEGKAPKDIGRFFDE